MTGAGSGFGRLVSQMAAARGASVVATDIDAAAAEATASSIVDEGGVATASEPTSSARPDMDRAARRSTLDRFGAIDILVNNAGVMPLAFFADHVEAAARVGSRDRHQLQRCRQRHQRGVRPDDHAKDEGTSSTSRRSTATRAPPARACTARPKLQSPCCSDSLRVEAQGKIKVTVVRPTGVLGTNLSAGVVNPAAIVGLTGQNVEQFGERVLARVGWDHYPQSNAIRMTCATGRSRQKICAAQIVAVIDLPWGDQHRRHHGAGHRRGLHQLIN